MVEQSFGGFPQMFEAMRSDALGKQQSGAIASIAGDIRAQKGIENLSDEELDATVAATVLERLAPLGLDAKTMDQTTSLIGQAVRARRPDASSADVGLLDDYTPESVDAYRRSGRFADLDPRTDGGGLDLTAAQERDNQSIDAARQQLEESGLDVDEVIRRSSPADALGVFDNPDFSPFMGGMVRTALKRKIGPDPEHERVLRTYGAGIRVPSDDGAGAAPPAAPRGAPEAPAGSPEAAAPKPMPGDPGQLEVGTRYRFRLKDGREATGTWNGSQIVDGQILGE